MVSMSFSAQWLMEWTLLKNWKSMAQKKDSPIWYILFFLVIAWFIFPDPIYEHKVVEITGTIDQSSIQKCENSQDCSFWTKEHDAAFKAEEHLYNVRNVSLKNFKYIKVASYDCSSFEFIKQLLKLKKPLIISTGATYEEEIVKTSQILKNINFAFLHCVSIYPTPLEKCNLSKINFLKKLTKNVGWSDHTLFEKTKHIASLISILQGASIIERHFTILPRDKTKDGPVSINEKDAKSIF